MLVKAIYRRGPAAAVIGSGVTGIKNPTLVSGAWLAICGKKEEKPLANIPSVKGGEPLGFECLIGKQQHKTY